MSRIKRTLTISQVLSLANDLIQKTVTQQRLIEWKKKQKNYHNSISNLSTVGRSYWQQFIKKINHLLCQKLISMYLIDCSNFTIYLNFADMYNQIEKHY